MSGRRCARVPGPLGVAVLVVGLAGGLVGCASSPEAARPGGAVLDPEAAEQIVAAHNGRIVRLATTSARGVIELRWRDEKGREHFEPQVNARLWVDLPRRTALRAEKLGDVLFWLGSDDDRFWLFDLLGEESRLYVGRHEEQVPLPAALPLSVRPLALIDLLGLAPIPRPATPPVASGDDWVFRVTGAGGPLRLHLDRATGLPSRVEVLGEDGLPLLSSRLRRYRTVTQVGVAPILRPKLPTLIDITDAAGSASVKLALDAPDDETRAEVFDLQRLTDHLRPRRTEIVGAR